MPGMLAYGTILVKACDIYTDVRELTHGVKSGEHASTSKFDVSVGLDTSGR